MPAVLIAVLTAVFNWALPRLLAIGATAMVGTAVSGPLLDWSHAQINAKLSGLGAISANFIMFTGIPEAVTILFAGYAAVVSIKSAKAAFSKKAAQ